jgi:2-hydroxymuconate-semialdehyde hydrolase
MVSKTITLKNKLNIHYFSAGNPDNPPLVLLHGWPSSSLLWRLLIPELSKHFHILAPDLPGHGQSDNPLNIKYNKEFFEQFILDFIDALGLEKIHLACHDLGALGGLSFVSTYPDRLNKFIVMNTSPYSNWSFRLSFTIFLLKQRMLTRLFLNKFIFKQVLKSGIYNHSLITPELIDIFRNPWMHSKESLSAFSKTIEIPPDQMIITQEKLNHIKTPTLILWGKNDIFFPMRVAWQLHKDIKNSTLIGVKNAAHFLQEEQPEFIQKEMISFLNESTEVMQKTKKVN